GQVASRINIYEPFERFHQLIAPESQFFPTARQLHSLAEARLDPARIGVIIGGSSILHGVGQRAGHVWTHRLQELLGDRFQVLNLAMRCGRTLEFGGVTAEALAVDHPRLIYVADYHGPSELDGVIYKYIFWDALSNGLIHLTEARQQW